MRKRLAEYSSVVVVLPNGTTKAMNVSTPGMVLRLSGADTNVITNFALSGLDDKGRLVYRPQEIHA